MENIQRIDDNILRLNAIKEEYKKKSIYLEEKHK